jgi:hypothetical protein
MRKGDILEEHDPNKAPVGCYLDSFLRLRILVLAYCVGCVGEERKFVMSPRESRVEVRLGMLPVRADSYTTTPSLIEAYIRGDSITLIRLIVSLNRTRFCFVLRYLKSLYRAWRER